MRLICPNCDAQYEVDDGAIPEAGRDVQCSNCGHAWFQVREVPSTDLSEDLYREPEPVAEVPAALSQFDDEETDEAPAPQPPAGIAPVQRTLDDSVLAVLREEAEREIAARKAEAVSGIEMQGDLGLPPPVSAVVATTAARINAADHDPTMAPDPAPRMRGAARRDLLPDIEEINSSLRPTEADDSSAESDVVERGKAASGFRSGFSLMLIFAILAVALYLMAPKIAVHIPGAADALASYVATIDSLRLALDAMMQRATGALNGTAGG